MWAGMLSAVVSIVVFTFIYSKVAAIEKAHKRIRTLSAVSKVLIFIVTTVFIVVLGVALQILVFNITDNEQLSEVMWWVVFGALFPLLLGAISSPRGTRR